MGIRNRHRSMLCPTLGGLALRLFAPSPGHRGPGRAQGSASEGPGARLLGREGCLTRCRVVFEGGIDQREVQHDRGIGAGGVREEVAFPGLALVLRAGLHMGERQPPAPAVQLRLLQHLVGERGPERTRYFLVTSGLENARTAPTQTEQ